MPAPSLLAMATRMAVMNAQHITDLADLPYALAKPMLARIDNPDQLRTIEINSPHIADHTAELWKSFIRRDCPSLKGDFPEPKNPRSWWKVYRKCHREEIALKTKQEDQLRKALKALGDQRSHVEISNEMRPVPWESSLNKDIASSAPFRHDGAFNTGLEARRNGTAPVKSTAKNGSNVIATFRKQAATARQQRLQARLPQWSMPLDKAPQPMIDDKLLKAGKLPRPNLDHAIATWGKIIAPSNGYSAINKTAAQPVRDNLAAMEARLKAAQANRPKLISTATPGPPAANSAPSSQLPSLPSTAPANERNPPTAGMAASSQKSHSSSRGRTPAKAHQSAKSVPPLVATAKTLAAPAAPLGSSSASKLRSNTSVSPDDSKRPALAAFSSVAPSTASSPSKSPGNIPGTPSPPSQVTVAPTIIPTVPVSNFQKRKPRQVSIFAPVKKRKL